MSEFKREHRYAVVKLKTGQLVDCVVIEKDWPEYETVWAMLEARMTGKQPPAVPDGYALVPVELNADQVFMIKDTMQVEGMHLTTWFITEVHKAMLAAAKGAQP